MSDVLHCKACGHALQVVCPAHGTEWTPDRRVNTIDDTPPRPRRSQHGAVPVPDRIVAAMLAAPVPRESWTIADVMTAVGISEKHAGVELSMLFKSGRVQRLRRGHYALPGTR